MPMSGAARRVKATASSQPGERAEIVLQAHDDLAARQLEGRVDAAVGHLALAGFEGDGGEVAAQVVAGQVVDDVVLVLGGEHDHFDIGFAGLAQAVQRGAQRGEAVRGDDGDAHPGRGRGAVEPACPGYRPHAARRPAASRRVHAAGMRLGGQAPVASSSPISSTTRAAAAATGSESVSPKVSTSRASTV